MPLFKLSKSSALRSACAFALGGGSFAIANIILAREMTPHEYGFVVLFVALTQLGATLGSAGMDTVALRHQIGPSAHLFMRVLTTASAFGGIAAVALIRFFDFGTELSCLLILAIVCAALNRLGCSFLQSLEHYRRGLGVMLAHNGVLLCATLILFAIGQLGIEMLAILLTAGYAMTALYGWHMGRRLLRARALHDSLRPLGREGLSIVASQMATAVLNQLDRILIPRLLSAGALGHYAAAATLCASPFNLLQSGARYTLLSRLKRASSNRDVALRVLRNEAVAAFCMATLAGSACLLLAPAIAQWLFAGRYTLEQGLVEVLVILGFLKVWHSFAAGCVQAMSSPRSLLILSIAGWAALAIAIAGAVAAETRDLEGLVSAIAFAWFLLCIAATLIATQTLLRLPQESDSRDSQRVAVTRSRYLA